MGANCCVAASRDKSPPNRSGCEVARYRNARQSPSWSFRLDNRTHIEDFMDNPSRVSHCNSGSIGSESKTAANMETDGLSNGGSPSDCLQTLEGQKKGGIDGSSVPVAADQSTRSNVSSEEKDDLGASNMGTVSDAKPSLSLPTTPSSSTNCLFQWDPSSSRKARHSPSSQLSRQVSCSNCSLEGRDPFLLSAGSNGGSSDGWSMRTFTELMEASASASSRRDQWSFDSEMIRPSPKSSNLQACKICLRPLNEKSPFGARKIISTNELSVIAVLVCGHAYHSECLERVTSETDRYDPPCPFCLYGEKMTIKLLGKSQSKAKSKMSKRAVAGIDDDFEWGGKSPSAGGKGSFGRPFLKRHFSIGSRAPPVGSVSESETTRKKKWFWPKCRRD